MKSVYKTDIMNGNWPVHQGQYTETDNTVPLQKSNHMSAVQTADKLARCLRKTLTINRTPEIQLWRLLETYLHDAEKASGYCADKIEIESVPLHRRWFISHYAYIQHLLLSSPTLRAFNLICTWLEQCYEETHNTSALPPLYSGAELFSHNASGMSYNTSCVTFLEFVLTCIRGGEIGKAIAASWSTNNCEYSCILNASQLKSVHEPWMNKTQVVALFGEYGHSEVSAPRDANTHANGATCFNSCAWYGNEGRLENLSIMYDEVRQYKQSSSETTESKSSVLPEGASYPLASKSVEKQATMERNDVYVSFPNGHKDAANNIITNTTVEVHDMEWHNRSESNLLTRKQLEAMIAAALCGEVDFLSTIFASSGDWQDFIWAELRCALILAINRTLIEANVPGISDDYANFIFGKTETTAAGPFDNNNKANWLHHFEERVVEKIISTLANSFLPHASTAEKLQIRVITLILTQSLRQGQTTECEFNPFDLNTVNTHDLCSVRLVTHLLLLLDAAHKENVTKFSIQHHASELLTRSLVAYGAALVKPNRASSLSLLNVIDNTTPCCSSKNDSTIANSNQKQYCLDEKLNNGEINYDISNAKVNSFMKFNDVCANTVPLDSPGTKGSKEAHAFLQAFHIGNNNYHDNNSHNTNKNSVFDACVSVFSNVVCQMIGMTSALYSDAHRARVYAHLLLCIRQEVILRKWLSHSETIELETYLIRQILADDHNVNKRKQVQIELLRHFCPAHKTIAREEHEEEQLQEEQEEEYMVEGEEQEEYQEEEELEKEESEEETRQESKDDKSQNSREYDNSENIEKMQFVRLTSSMKTEQIMWSLQFALTEKDVLEVIQQSLQRCAELWSAYVAEHDVNMLNAIDEMVNVIFKRLPTTVMACSKVDNNSKFRDGEEHYLSFIPETASEAVHFWQLVMLIRQGSLCHEQLIHELRTTCLQNVNITNREKRNEEFARLESEQLSYTAMYKLLKTEFEQLGTIKECIVQAIDKVNAVITNLHNASCARLLLDTTRTNQEQVKSRRKHIAICVVFLIKLFAEQVALRITFETDLFAKYNLERKYNLQTNKNDSRREYSSYSVNNNGSSYHYAGNSRSNIDINQNTNLFATVNSSSMDADSVKFDNLFNFCEWDQEVNQITRAVLEMISMLDAKGYLQCEYITPAVASELYSCVRDMKIMTMKRTHQRHATQLLCNLTKENKECVLKQIEEKEEHEEQEEWEELETN